MSMRDDINKLYQPSKTLRQVCAILFFSDIIISIVAVYVENVVASSYLTIILIIVALFYMAFSVIDDGIVWFNAESARRKNSIQVAFNIRLAEHETEGYYNNTIVDPELAYATNQFESVFFTKKISEKMLLGSVIKMLVAVAALIVSCRLIANDNILIIVAQTAFSAVVVEDSVRFLLFYQRINSLFDEAYHEFITVGISNEKQKVWLKYFCVEYESIKAHYRVRLSEYLFKKLNTKLSEKWDTISEQITISLIK